MALRLVDLIIASLKVPALFTKTKSVRRRISQLWKLLQVLAIDVIKNNLIVA